MLVSQQLEIGYSTSTKVWGNLVTWKSKIQSPLWQGEGWIVAIIQYLWQLIWIERLYKT